MKNGNPRIEWSQKSEKQCLKFTFGERLTAKEAEAAIGEWRKVFQNIPNNLIILIWDCRKMKGYDSDARVKWTDAIKEMKSQIDTIWLIADSSFIKMGAAVMGMVTSLNIKTIRSESEMII